MYNPKNILLSVIIPHRDIPQLLRRCIDSIPLRDNVQIIVVDDCSSQNLSPKIDPYLNDKAYIYYCDNQKGGGAARNIGLKYARGQWVTFIDADDFFTSNFNYVLDILKSLPKNVDVLYCSANSLDSEYLTPSDRAKNINKYISLHQDKLNRKEGENLLRYRFGEPWCKIVRRKLITDNCIRFSETSIHNDTKYSYLVGYYAREIESIPYALCTITSRSGSVSRSITEAKKIERIAICAEEHKFFREKGIPTRYAMNFLWPQMARSLFESRATFKEEYKILKANGISTCEIIGQIIKHFFRNQLVKLYHAIIHH